MLSVVSLVVGYYFGHLRKGDTSLLTQGLDSIKELTSAPEKNLQKYSFENLRSRPYQSGQIVIDKIIKEEKLFTSYLFFFTYEGKRVSGQVNLPRDPKLIGSDPLRGTDPLENKYPVVLMLRGYVDKEKYKTGDGTRRAAAVFAQNGFITLAPDFLGYGASDPADEDPLISRFETYVTSINLLNSVASLPFAMSEKLFLWGHSNGGQVALSVLEITGRNIPTTLWAPVSKPFPYSVLFYSDEASDSGKLLRGVIADFDKNYAAENYSLVSYLNWINGPLQIHQGLADDAVLPRWSSELVKSLKDLEKEVKYYEYPGANHNFLGPSWAWVVERDIKFFKQFIISND